MVVIVKSGLGAKRTLEPVTTEPSESLANDRLGSVMSEPLGLVTNELLGPVTSEPLRVANELLGPVTNEPLGPVTSEPLGPVTNERSGSTTLELENDERKLSIKTHQLRATQVLQRKGASLTSRGFGLAQDFQFIKIRSGYIFKIIHAVTPWIFYAKYVSERPEFFEKEGVKDALHEGMKTVYNDLQCFYKKQEWRASCELKTEAVKGHWYAFYDDQTGTWERVRVVKVDPPIRRCQVETIDFGSRQWVYWSQLWELLPYFTEQPADALVCKMINIRQADGQQRWSQKECNHFRKKVVGKTFLAIILNKTIELVDGSTIANRAKLDVTLIGQGKSGSYDRNMESELIQAGIGIGIGRPNR